MPYVDKAKQRAYQNRWTQKRRLDWIDSQGGRCVKCGSQERLEVDHRERSEKEIHTRHLWGMKSSRRVVELLKCWVLCHECHLTKTMEENKVDPTYRRNFEREVYVGQ